MICHGFKGGIGTASRRLAADAGGYTVGVLVQCNYGGRPGLRVAGVPVGARSRICSPAGSATLRTIAASPAMRRARRSAERRLDPEQGSIIVVVATDAPLMPHQLKRLATRVSLGIGRMGGIGADSSGDIFVAFSTANPEERRRDRSGAGGIDREPENERAVRRDRPGDRRGDSQRAPRSGDDDRSGRLARLRATARSPARRAAKIQRAEVTGRFVRPSRHDSRRLRRLRSMTVLAPRVSSRCARSPWGVFANLASQSVMSRRSSSRSARSSSIR